MSKYLCLCGAQYDNRAGVNLHLKDIDNNAAHIILKRKWRGRMLDFILDLYSPKLIRIIGLIGVHTVFINHFHYSWWESLISAMCLGFLI